MPLSRYLSIIEVLTSFIFNSPTYPNCCILLDQHTMKQWFPFCKKLTNLIFKRTICKKNRNYHRNCICTKEKKQESSKSVQFLSAILFTTVEHITITLQLEHTISYQYGIELTMFAGTRFISWLQLSIPSDPNMLCTMFYGLQTDSTIIWRDGIIHINGVYSITMITTSSLLYW